MATQLYSFASGPLPTGVTTIPVTAITGYTQSLSCLVTQAAGANAILWANPATQVTIALQVSYDGGTTWVDGGSSFHQGSVGAKIATATQFGGIYGYSAVPTHFQGTITIANGPITLAGSISVT